MSIRCPQRSSIARPRRRPGLLYTAKGTAALLVPLVPLVPLASVVAAQGGWSAVFITASALNLVAAFLALAVLKPMRRRMQSA